jgi:hypothetical protein
MPGFCRQTFSSDFKEWKMKRRYEEDPVLGDEDDPSYMEEMFETFKELGWSPEKIQDEKYRKAYADWLETHSDNE